MQYTAEQRMGERTRITGAIATECSCRCSAVAITSDTSFWAPQVEAQWPRYNSRQGVAGEPARARGCKSTRLTVWQNLTGGGKIHVTCAMLDDARCARRPYSDCCLASLVETDSCTRPRGRLPIRKATNSTPSHMKLRRPTACHPSRSCAGLQVVESWPRSTTCTVRLRPRGFGEAIATVTKLC